MDGVPRIFERLLPAAVLKEGMPITIPGGHSLLDPTPRVDVYPALMVALQRSLSPLRSLWVQLRDQLGKQAPSVHREEVHPALAAPLPPVVR